MVVARRFPPEQRRLNRAARKNYEVGPKKNWKAPSFFLGPTSFCEGVVAESAEAGYLYKYGVWPVFYDSASPAGRAVYWKSFSPKRGKVAMMCSITWASSIS